MKFPMTVSKARIVKTMAIIIIWVRLYGDEGGPRCTGANVVVTLISLSVTLFSRLRKVVYAETLKLMLLSVVKWVISATMRGLSPTIPLHIHVCWQLVSVCVWLIFPSILNSPKDIFFYQTSWKLLRLSPRQNEILFPFQSRSRHEINFQNGFEFQHIGYWTSVRVWIPTVIIILAECSIWEKEFFSDARRTRALPFRPFFSSSFSRLLLEGCILISAFSDIGELRFLLRLIQFDKITLSNAKHFNITSDIKY